MPFIINDPGEVTPTKLENRGYEIISSLSLPQDLARGRLVSSLLRGSDQKADYFLHSPELSNCKTILVHILLYYFRMPLSACLLHTDHRNDKRMAAKRFFYKEPK